MTSTEVPVISDKGSGPTPLSDRWGEYLSRDILDDHWVNAREGQPAREVYENLRGVYDQGEADEHGNPLREGFSTGDPRSHLHEECSFLAYFQGKLGILVERELLCSYHSDSVKADDQELSADGFENLSSALQAKLKQLDQHYEHTRFFIGHGDASYEGRVTINAFTPLLNGEIPGPIRIAPESKMVMASPYHDPQVNFDIGDCDVLWEITQALEEVASEVGSRFDVRGREKAA